MPLRKFSTSSNLRASAQMGMSREEDQASVQQQVASALETLRYNGASIRESAGRDVERSRVEEVTNLKSRLARTVGMGPRATEAVASAVKSEQASVQSVAKAIEYRVKISHARSEVRRAANRVVSALGSGVVEDSLNLASNLVFKARGVEARLNTEQGDITRHLRQMAVDKTISGALLAAGDDQAKLDLVKQAAVLAVENINSGLKSKSAVSLDALRSTVPQGGIESTPVAVDRWEIAEIKRVKEHTTRLKRFGRVLSIGPKATGIVKNAVSSEARTPESVAIAIDNKIKVSTRRSNIRHVPERMLEFVASGYGIRDLNRKSMGMPTRQGNLSRQLKEKATERAINSAIKAAGADPSAHDVVDRALKNKGLDARRRSTGR